MSVFKAIIKMLLFMKIRNDLVTFLFAGDVVYSSVGD